MSDTPGPVREDVIAYSQDLERRLAASQVEHAEMVKSFNFLVNMAQDKIEEIAALKQRLAESERYRNDVWLSGKEKW